MVYWKAKLSNGDLLSGPTDNGSWANLPDMLLTYKPPQKIVSLKIENECGGGMIDNNCDGYFIGNKSIAIMGLQADINMVGIGYWRKNESVVRIKWYDSHNMNLVTNEARALDKCGFFLVKNPLKISDN